MSPRSPGNRRFLRALLLFPVLPAGILAGIHLFFPSRAECISSVVIEDAEAKCMWFDPSGEVLLQFRHHPNAAFIRRRVTDGAVEREIPLPRFPEGYDYFAVFSRDRSNILYLDESFAEGPRLRIYDSGSGVEKASIALKGPLEEADCGRDGSRIAYSISGKEGGQIRVVDAMSGNIVFGLEPKIPGMKRHILLSPSGRYLITALPSGGPSESFLYDLTAGTKMPLHWNYQVHSRFSDDESRLYTGAGSSIDLATGDRESVDVEHPGRSLGNSSVSPDGSLLAQSGWLDSNSFLKKDGSMAVKIYEIGSGKRVGILWDQIQPVFRADGTLLTRTLPLSANEGTKISIWKMPFRKPWALIAFTSAGLWVAYLAAYALIRRHIIEIC